jgi:hypothetical protein
MLMDGTYAAWFNTPLGEGTGIVHLHDGVVTGGSDVLTYTGTYEKDGDRFQAVIRTKRYASGHLTLFGPDELTLRLVGECSTMFSRCTGRADEVPDLLFEALLIRSQPEDAPKPRLSPTDYHPERLPSTPPQRR